MFNNKISCALTLAALFTMLNVSQASLVLVIEDSNSSAIEIVIDNAAAGVTSGSWTSTVADNNSILGQAGFSSAFGDYNTLTATALSKPALTGNQLDLSGEASTLSSVGAAEVWIYTIDTGFSGGGDEFLTELGGTTEGFFDGGSFLSANSDDPMGFTPVSWSPVFSGGPFSWSETATQTHSDPFGMGVQAAVSFTGPGVTSWDLSFKQLSGAVPEPTTALIWTTLAGLGFVVRRRR